MEQKKRNIVRKGGLLSLFLIGVTVALVLSFTTNPTEILQSVGQRGWQNIASAGTPTAGQSGVYFIYIYPHSGTPATAYKANLSNASAYAYGSLNATLTGSVPYATTFDIVVKCRYNASNAFNTTSNTWELCYSTAPTTSWIRANMTCAALSIAAYTNMSRAIIHATNTSAGGSTYSYAFIHYYLNNGGAGYTIARGQTINVTLFRISYYG